MRYLLLISAFLYVSFSASAQKLEATVDSMLVKFQCVDQDLIPEDSTFIQIIAPDGKVVGEGYSDIDGICKFLVMEGFTYNIKATKYNTTKDLLPFEAPLLPGQRKTKNIRLKINFFEKKYSDKWELAVYFKTNEHTLDFHDLAALNALYEKMIESENMRVEIAAHTDNVGDDRYNMRLSQRRANSVRGYIVGKGIDPARIVSKGYGETDPVQTNDTEEGRAKNRRTEVRVLAGN